MVFGHVSQGWQQPMRGSSLASETVVRFSIASKTCCCCGDHTRLGARNNWFAVLSDGSSYPNASCRSTLALASMRLAKVTIRDLPSPRSSKSSAASRMSCSTLASQAAFRSSLLGFKEAARCTMFSATSSFVGWPDICLEHIFLESCGPSADKNVQQLEGELHGNGGL